MELVLSNLASPPYLPVRSPTQSFLSISVNPTNMLLSVISQYCSLDSRQLTNRGVYLKYDHRLCICGALLGTGLFITDLFDHNSP